MNFVFARVCAGHSAKAARSNLFGIYNAIAYDVIASSPPFALALPAPRKDIVYYSF